MKKITICLLSFIFSIFILTACTKNETLSDTSSFSSSEEEEVEEKAHIDMRIQEYNDNSDYGEEIFEIPIFLSNTYNCEIEKLNIKISTLMDYYTGNYEGHNFEDTWNIISYPISNNEYLQVVTTAISYPNYGTDGEVFSFNYDLTNKEMMTLSDAYNYDKKSIEEIKSQIESLYNQSKSNDKSTLTKIDINGFLIQDRTVNYFITIYENNPGIGESNSIYTYNSAHNSLEKYISPCLINPDKVDDDFTNLFCKREDIRNNYFNNLHDSNNSNK